MGRPLRANRLRRPQTCKDTIDDASPRDAGANGSAPMNSGETVLRSFRQLLCELSIKVCACTRRTGGSGRFFLSSFARRSTRNIAAPKRPAHRSCSAIPALEAR
mmetsp:Transcript_20182/g.56239  ORF Transcript_20182/g.56239 Transcript_20182/m.56239 type:complete len:104 (+) Transcript_20182:452-763(+)